MMGRCLVLLLLAVSVTAAGDEGSKVGFYGLSYLSHPDLQVAALEIASDTDWFSDVEWVSVSISLPFEFYRFRGDPKVHTQLDPFIGLGALLPFMAVDLYCDRCDPWIKPMIWIVAPVALPAVHPTLIVRPVAPLGLTLGWDSAYIFQPDDKGMSFAPRLGLLLEPHAFVRFEGGVNHQNFWNWKRSSETFGWGWFARVSLSTDWIGGGHFGPSYD